MATPLPGTRAAGDPDPASDVNLLTAAIVEVRSAKTDTSYVDAADLALRSRVVVGADITASRGLVVADAGGSFDAVSASADIALNVPLASAENFTAGDTMLVRRGGAGAVTFTVTAGVTLDSDGDKVAIGKQNQMVSLQYRGADVWWLTGALA